jgi:tetratricopeptide (TPR) repeat protein
MTPTLRARSAVALLALLSLPILTIAAASDDFSARLDTLWDFDHPAAAEAKFLAELARHPAGSREARESATQLARSLGLQRKFAEADATLDALLQNLNPSPARIRVRYLLERGRVRNSSGQPDAAVPLFKEAVAAAKTDALPGADFYLIDALHMLGIAAPAGERLDWNLQALGVADASGDARARGWRGSLLHNLGWTYHDRNDYATALDYWQKAQKAREEAGDLGRIRVARWTVARGLRSLGRLDEADTIQRALAAETERDGAPDGFIYEELMEIALARNDAKSAKPWAAKAHALLKDDISINANEQGRLARLANVAGIAAATSRP